MTGSWNYVVRCMGAAPVSQVRNNASPARRTGFTVLSNTCLAVKLRWTDEPTNENIIV